MAVSVFHTTASRNGYRRTLLDNPLWLEFNSFWTYVGYISTSFRSVVNVDNWTVIMFTCEEQPAC